ncbi:hypothetical protein I0P70_13660 [Pontibacter sp. FD36]|uniref:hypothetical protein n=1 Tax=Pontibacter sp. FD36 TaxID=2789860 RepID=UPI0018AC7608|nr:hypothetical protein [Pontibacter sp. FD36]MBF8964296.1 hypothetical protein [Pontibacter sp. FD36]
MNLTINPFQIRTVVAKYRAELIKTYTTTTEEGLSTLHLVVFGDSTDSTIVRDMLTDAIENRYN